MKTRTVLAALLLLSVSPAFGIVRCVDPNTGAVTYSDRACPKGGGEEVRFHRGNAASSTHFREEIERKRLEEEQDAQERRTYSEADQRRVKAVQQQRRQGEWDKLCKEGIKPYKGSQNGQLTTAQRRLLMECAGIPAKGHGTSDAAPTTMPVPVPAAQPTPSTITNCDAGGCWDNQGGRYRKGAGPTHIRQDGKVCQRIGELMQCP